MDQQRRRSPLTAWGGWSLRTDIQAGHRPTQVLILAHQPVLADYVTLALSHGSFVTQVVQTVAEALAALEQRPPHLAIVDMDLTDGQVLDRLGYTASATSRIPVVALTRRGDLVTKLAAFEAGVDDILTIPFSPEELVARVVVIMRRTYRESAVFTPVIRVGELEIDILHRRVLAQGSELNLTPVEQSLLYLLAANAGRLLTRDQILDTVWGTDFVAGSNLVDRHVRNLRIKLQNSHRKPRYIATVPGQGYRFIPTSADEPAAGSSP